MAPAVGGVLAAQAMASAAATAAAGILGAFDALLAARAERLRTGFDVQLAADRPALPADDRARLVAEELERERAFAAKARARVARDLPGALAIADRAAREQAVRAIVDRERRYLTQREDAIAARLLGHVTAAAVRDVSPDGAFWKLNPALDNCARCASLAGKVWPWAVLDLLKPPIHPNCACSLFSVADARRLGWLTDADRGSFDDLVREPALLLEALADALHVEPLPVAPEIEPVRELDAELDVVSLPVADLKPGSRLMVAGTPHEVAEVLGGGLVTLHELGLVRLSRDTVRGIPAPPEQVPAGKPKIRATAELREPVLEVDR